MFLDEVDEWPNQYRSMGLVLAYGTQSKEMIAKRHGREGAERILKGLTLQAIFQLNDLETCKQYSELVGKEDVVFDTSSQSKSKSGRSTSDTEHRQTRRIVTPTEIAQFPRGKALVLSRGNATAQRVRVPLLHEFGIPDHDLAVMQASRDWWDLELARRRANAQFQPYGDAEFVQREQAIAAMFGTDGDPDAVALETDECVSLQQSMHLKPLQA